MIFQDTHAFNVGLTWMCVCLLFYVLETFKVISEREPISDSAHSWRLYSAAPLGNKQRGGNTMTWYPTHSHYPDTEPTSPCPILIMQSIWLGGHTYKTSESLVWLDQGSNPEGSESSISQNGIWMVIQQEVWFGKPIGIMLAPKRYGHLLSPCSTNPLICLLSLLFIKRATIFENSQTCIVWYFRLSTRPFIEIYSVDHYNLLYWKVRFIICQLNWLTLEITEF